MNASPHNDPITSKAARDRQLNIPTEIWEKIFALLDLNDIKSVRLAWRRWTNVAGRFLFRTFIFRVDRQDFGRFEIVTENEAMLAGINRIRLETGPMGIDHVARRLGFEYMQEYNSARLPGSRSKYTHDELELAKDMAIQEYAAWNTRWHAAKQDFRDLKKMKEMLAKLKSLRRIDVTAKGITFTTELLLGAWMQGSGLFNFKRATKEFVTLLLALKDAPFQLKHLSHDQLPVTFFAMKESLLGSLASSLQHITTLRLTIDACNYPHTKCWNGLGHFLRSIPGLTVLRFGFDPFETGTVNRGTWLYAEDDLAQWYIPLWKMLGDHTWKDLRSLRLDSLMVCETGLNEMLIRHAPTLQCLDLFNLGLWTGSFQGLLSNLREGLKLKRFRLWGATRGFHTPYDGWRLKPTLNLDEEVWSSHLKAHVIDEDSKLNEAWERFESISSPDVGRRLDLFMTPGISWPWPLYASDALERLIRPPYFGGHHSDQCQECVRSIDEINDAWNAGVKKSLEGWSDNNASCTRGIGEEEVIDFYDEDGLDTGGFDANGFDTEGTYFMDIYEDWQGAKDPISTYAAKRTFRDGILSQIPRYSQKSTRLLST